MNYWVYIDIGTGPEWHLAVTLIQFAELNRDTGEMNYNSAIYLPIEDHYLHWDEIEALPDGCVKIITPPNYEPVTA